MDLDVAVVGGGVSGCYSAWRLQQEKGAHAKIGLFEYSDRIGGRLYTVTLPGIPHVKAEVGGMRYIPDQHIMVASLVDHLQLPTSDFPMGAPPPATSLKLSSNRAGGVVFNRYPHAPAQRASKIRRSSS